MTASEAPPHGRRRARRLRRLVLVLLGVDAALIALAVALVLSGVRPWEGDHALRGSRPPAGQHLPDLDPEFPAHGKNCAGLDHDFEYLDFFAGEIKQAAGEDQVPGRRNRQKFGQAFDDAHDQRLERENEVHLWGVMVE